MKITQYIVIPIMSIILLTNCVPNPSRLEQGSKDKIKPTEKGFSIMFYHLDNYAMVYHNDRLIADTRKLNSSTETDIDVLVDLTKLVGRPDKGTIKIEGYNAECDFCRENRWKIIYEIFKNGESMEYVTKESGKHDDAGIKFEEYHDLSNLSN